ncbi:hypothetical protein DFJ73DRAFT_772336 [Zopfochytrium polystomum]|nr:hypothetical protein DFJ73DRAFT_772336 [Zopfochytrium polystomum]
MSAATIPADHNHQHPKSSDPRRRRRRRSVAVDDDAIRNDAPSSPLLHGSPALARRIVAQPQQLRPASGGRASSVHDEDTMVDFAPSAGGGSPSAFVDVDDVADFDDAASSGQDSLFGEAPNSAGEEQDSLFESDSADDDEDDERKESSGSKDKDTPKDPSSKSKTKKKNKKSRPLVRAKYKLKVAPSDRKFNVKGAILNAASGSGLKAVTGGNLTSVNSTTGTNSTDAKIVLGSAGTATDGVAILAGNGTSAPVDVLQNTGAKPYNPTVVIILGVLIGIIALVGCTAGMLVYFGNRSAYSQIGTDKPAAITPPSYEKKEVKSEYESTLPDEITVRWIRDEVFQFRKMLHQRTLRQQPRLLSSRRLLPKHSAALPPPP